MGLFGFIAHLVLCGLMAGLGLLMWGVLRVQGRLSWRLEQWESATPRRRRGLGVGSRAPDFALPAAGMGRVRLRDFAGRTVLLVFADDPRGLLAELNRLQRRGDLQVLLVRNSAGDGREGIPVLRQTGGRLSRRYRVLETPFAFVIDERGRIAAKGLVRSGLHLQFLLDAARTGRRAGPAMIRQPEAESTRPPRGSATSGHARTTSSS